jgi:hypothetical protein
MDESSPLYAASLQTPFPGNEQAGYMEELGDPRIIDFPLQPDTRDPRFYHNLAHYLSEGELSRIGTHLTEAIQSDDDGRQKWLRIVRDAIDYLGIGSDRAKGGNYSKSADIYAPTLLKITAYNASKLHSNLFPSENFVDCKTWGTATQDIEDQAYRMKEFANYMLEDVMTDYFDDKEQAFFWVVLAGNVFSKPYLDKTRNQPTCPYIRPEDIIINSGASSISDAERVTHRYTLAHRLVEEKFKSGEWRRVYVEDYDMQEDVIRQKMESKLGVQTQNDDVNKIHCFDECMCYLDLDGFNHLDKEGAASGRALPYIVTKDKSNNNIVDVRRNWIEQDQHFRPIKRIIQWKYFSGWGPYGFGLSHLALGLAKAETEIQQQLILAAKLSNAPSLLQANTLKNERTQINIVPGSINQMATFDNKIQDAFMPLPFKEPSAVLLQLKDQIAQSMQDLSAATDFDPEQIPANTGELLTAAIISTSHILESSVMKSMYRSFSDELKLLFNIFSEWLPASPYPFEVPGGSHVIMREDFTPSIRIKPSIDPNSSSMMHQLVMGESLLNLAEKNPDLYNIRAIHKKILNAMKIGDIDSVMVADPDETPIPELDFITENTRALKNEPIQAYPTQDHDAHIIGHQDMSEKLSNDESQDYTQQIAALSAHLSDHKMYKYLAQIQALMGETMPQDMEKVSEAVQNKISVKAAAAIQKQQAQQAKDNPPPIDPNVVMMEELKVKQREAELKNQQHQADLQLEEHKLRLEAQQKAAEQQIKQQDIELKMRQLQIEEMRLRIQEQEMQQNMQLRMAELQMQQEKTQLETQAKTYEATLKYEADRESDQEQLAQDAREADLVAQTKAFDSTLKYQQGTDATKMTALTTMTANKTKNKEPKK